MTTHDLVIENARMHLPGGAVSDGWLAVRDGRIAAIGAGDAPDAELVHDAAGSELLPGAIDIHTHFRDPGDTEKEDFSTGTLAAACGGVTTVVDMPNTGHQVITPDDFREKRDHVAGRSWVDYGLHAQFDDSSACVPELAALGVAGLKWMMGYAEWKGLRCQPTSNAEARATLIAAAQAGVLVGVHAESLRWLQDLRASLRGPQHTEVSVHAESRPPFVEAIAVAEVAILAAEFGCRMHIHHLTSALPLRTAVALREELAAQLTVETCPAYLFLTDADVERQGVGIQVNPPMRSADDQAAMWEGLRSGEIYCVASDHAPTLPADKLRDSPLDVLPGIVGVETMLPLLLDAAARGSITLSRVVELLCSHPAQLVRLSHRKGALTPGYDADLVLVDMAAETTISGAALHSKQRMTPYEGRICKAAITDVFVRGRPVVQARAVVAQTPFGEHAPSRYETAAESTTHPADLVAA